MGRIYRKIWIENHHAKSDGFLCDECLERIETETKYQRVVCEYTTEKGRKVLQVMREHLSPGCNEYS